MFLSPAELQALTGRKQPRKQIQWLATNGLRFFVRADGKPAVPVDQVARPVDLTPARRSA